MKQLAKVKSANRRIKDCYSEIEKQQEKIKQLKKSMTYKLVQKGTKAEGDYGVLSMHPSLDNDRMLLIEVNRDFNKFHGLTLRSSSVRRLRNYLNDFLKTR